jgi:hypothetical protein
MGHVLKDMNVTLNHYMEKQVLFSDPAIEAPEHQGT